MWVNAIRMRHNGRKLPLAQLEGVAPTLGRLWVTKLHGLSIDGREDFPLTATLLGPRGSEQSCFPQLDRARVKVRDGQVMVLGFEDHGHHYKSPKPVPQVWWCDPVYEPFDEVEAAAKARFPPTRGRLRRETEERAAAPG